MSWKQPRRTGIEGFAIALAGMLLCAAAQAAGLYRWTDAQGGVVYGDKPPKDARNVIRVDVDTATTTFPPAPTAPPPPRVSAPVLRPETAQAPAFPDILTQRRATRARLEENLELARGKLDLARKNLAEATDMAPDEQQSIIEKVGDVPPPAGATPNPTIDPGSMQVMGGGMYGMSVARSNCTTVVGKSGKAGIICPTIIPNAAYQQRIAALEDAVKKAEDEVSAAQEAYRRGVD